MLIWVVLLTKPAVPWGVCLHVISIPINILKICKFSDFRSPGSMTETRWSRRVSERGPSWWRTTNVSLQFLISSSRQKWNTTTGTSLVRPRTRPSRSRSPSPPGNWKRNNQTYVFFVVGIRFALSIKTPAKYVGPSVVIWIKQYHSKAEAWDFKWSMYVYFYPLALQRRIFFSLEQYPPLPPFCSSFSMFLHPHLVGTSFNHCDFLLFKKNSHLWPYGPGARSL